MTDPTAHARDAPEQMAPPLRYRFGIDLLTPLLLLWVAVIAWRQARPRKDARRFMAQRLGYSCPSVAQQPRWIHAASVGEVLTALPLIQAVQHESLLVTTATVTGAAVLAQHAPEVAHCYLPIDRPAAVARFLDSVKPASGWIVETEIWPWLFASARKRAVPLTIINARLSERTLKGAQRGLAPVYAQALTEVHILARSAADAERYRMLGGVNATPATVVGDLKLAAPVDTRSISAPIDRPYVLAASTHDDEETQLAAAWSGQASSLLLVIAPRHPERGAKLAVNLSPIAGHSIHRRSLRESALATDRIYLADTLGELNHWYAHAHAVFVGGSLIPRGGHNLMEPARAARAIVTGMHTDNFTETVATLRAAGALQQVDSATEVVNWLISLTQDQRHTMGARARTAAMADTDLLQRYLEALGFEG